MTINEHQDDEQVRAEALGRATPSTRPSAEPSCEPVAKEAERAARQLGASGPLGSVGKQPDSIEDPLVIPVGKISEDETQFISHSSSSGGFKVHQPGVQAEVQHSLDGRISGVGLTLLNSIGEGVAVLTRQGELVWGNDHVQQLSGAMKERLGVACRQFDREHPPIPANYKLPPGYIPPRSISPLSDDTRSFSVSATPLPAESDANGLSPDLLLVIVTNVTETRRLQNKISAIDHAGSELMKLDAEMVRKFNAVERLGLLRDRIIRSAQSLLHFDHFAIRLLDVKHNRLRLTIAHNIPDEYDAYIIMPRLEGHGITGYVAASGVSYICNDIKKDPLYIKGIENAQSSLTLPLRVNDKIIGVINVESERLAAFTEEDRQLGEIFARYVAMAINVLDLLVVGQIETNQSVAGRVIREIDEPLQDIAHQVELLRLHDGADAYVNEHLRSISEDLVKIRTRIKACSSGPQCLLDVDSAMADDSVEPLLEGKRVLVADDDNGIRRMIGDYLSRKGCKLTLCASGAEAITALHASPRGFELILSDIDMPEANGYEVFSAARATCPGVAVILMTGFGYDANHSIVRAAPEGLHKSLFKPFELKRLLADVRSAFEPPAPAPEPAANG